MTKKISLKQFLMRTGQFEKSFDCESAIREGKVTLNRKIATNPRFLFNPGKDVVKINDKKIKIIKKLYFVMNKPAGYVTQKSNYEKNVYDLLKKLNLSENEIKSLFAAGMLDKETEGLLIITNDGKLSKAVMNPGNNIEKNYFAILEKPSSREGIKKLEEGVFIADDKQKYITLPAKIRMKNEKEIYITITEGKKRQIRKMLEAVGNKVIYLRRESINGLTLKNIEIGQIVQLARIDLYKKLVLIL